MESFLWIVVLGAIVCFLTAFAIGANDVANTFSTSVGSRAVTLSAAICMAALLETLGATLLGGAVTDSIRSKIIGAFFKSWKGTVFTDAFPEPNVFFGCLPAQRPPQTSTPSGASRPF